MKPASISIADYNYALPQENIAWHPLTDRDASRLLIYQGGTGTGGTIKEDTYRHIGDHLPKESLLIFNNTKVVEARIVFRKETGARVEIFCLEPPPDYGGIGTAMSQKGKVRWKCLIGGASKWKPGQVLTKTVTSPPTDSITPPPTDSITATDSTTGTSSITASPPLTLEARFLDKQEDAFLIELSWTPAELTFAEMLHVAGLVPLPPYIKRTAESSDTERYQTIYARHDGSVAAPTAGLHFTAAVFEDLAAKSIRHSFVTLHVGAGTFLPVKAAVMEQHIMHVEWIVVTEGTILALRNSLQTNKPLIAVGTTSARTIESLYWLGIKTMTTPDIAPEDLVVQQWDAYTAGPTVQPEEALTRLLDWMKRQGLSQLTTTTQLLIAPGYTWRIVQGLVTNFHQPESTLLLLIAALIGEDWKKLYHYALQHGFRFLSYGDGCLLLPGSPPSKLPGSPPSKSPESSPPK